MKIEFMVEHNHHYNSDLEYKIVDSYWSDDLNSGYDIYRVEADSIADIRVIFADGTEYRGAGSMCFGDVVYITEWTLVDDYDEEDFEYLISPDALLADGYRVVVNPAPDFTDPAAAQWELD
jgi:hypothetical protein